MIITQLQLEQNPHLKDLLDEYPEYQQQQSDPWTNFEWFFVDPSHPNIVLIGLFVDKNILDDYESKTFFY